MTVLVLIMGKISNRDRILSEGLRVVHAQGFAGASVRDIVTAAGVPQGSFSNHFASKEAFGLEVLNLYYADAKARMASTLQNESLTPLNRLHEWIGSIKTGIAGNDMKIGCMFGNFSAEATNCNGLIRLRLTEIFAEMQDAVSACLKAAVKAKELPQGFKLAETAGFIMSSIQGAILLSKAHRNIEPIEQFEQILFSKVLR
jgi:TetR/AcrR family transcriptional repressor of nem operon